MEKMSSRELYCGIKSLCKVIPTLQLCISPTLNVAHDLQSEVGNCNLKPLNHTHSKLWHTCVCVSCQTRELHTENDCTYTIITTPRQANESYKGTEVNFILELMHHDNVGVKLDPGTTFLFSGKYLTHRQSMSDNSASPNVPFINIASYGNERLYHRFKSTIKIVYTYSYFPTVT